MDGWEHSLDVYVAENPLRRTHKDTSTLKDTTTHMLALLLELLELLDGAIKINACH